MKKRNSQNKTLSFTSRLSNITDEVKSYSVDINLGDLLKYVSLVFSVMF